MDGNKHPHVFRTFRFLPPPPTSLELSAALLALLPTLFLTISSIGAPSARPLPIPQSLTTLARRTPRDHRPPRPQPHDPAARRRHPCSPSFQVLRRVQPHCWLRPRVVGPRAACAWRHQRRVRLTVGRKQLPGSDCICGADVACHWKLLDHHDGDEGVQARWQGLRTGSRGEGEERERV